MINNGIFRDGHECDMVALLAGQRTCDSQVMVRVVAGHHCIVASGKLLTPVCLCHQAV